MVASTERKARGRPPVGLGHYLRDIVYGASDGIITTMAVIAGAAGASFEPRVGVVLGLANLAADGISMGASNYLGLKSELAQTGVSVAHEKPWRHGLATTAAFMLAGAVPLCSYAFQGHAPARQFQLALVLAFAVLMALAVLRARVVGEPLLRSARELTLVLGSASAAAYVLGALVAPRWS